MHDLRDWTHDRHRTVDDTPFGGGAGMVMRPDVWGRGACDDAACEPTAPHLLRARRPSGEPFTQRHAERAGRRARTWSFACGRYEGIDERVAEHDRARGRASPRSRLGDYVLNGGEVAVLVVVEAVARLLPGVVGNAESLVEESHGAAGLLEYPVYTKPPRLARARGARGAAVRAPRADRAVAARPGARADGPAPPGPARRRSTRRDLDASATARVLAALGVARRSDGRPASSVRAGEPLWQTGPSVRAGRVSATGERRTTTGLHRPDAPDRQTDAARPACAPTTRLTCGRAGKRHTMHTLDTVDAASLRDDIPDFRAGDTLKVHVKVVEGTRSRIQVFQGVVIRRQGGGVRETFTVRKVSFGVGVERTFPVHSPIVDKIEVVTRGDVRRAKLYYLRDLRGKTAKIKEKRDAVPPKKA